MADARRPDGDRDDPLLRAVTDNWDEIQRFADQQQRERLLGLIDGTIEPDRAEARAALADELLDLLPPDHPVIRVLRAGVMYRRQEDTGIAALDLNLDRRSEPFLRPAGDADSMPVTIYMSEEQIHAQVEKAVEVLLATAGLYIKERKNPVVGSWFRRMAAGTKEARQSPAGREAMLVVEHALDSRLVLAQDAEVTARLLQNLAPVLGALQPTRDAVIRVGALLIVKLDWTVNIFQLSAAQQVRLDHHPKLASSPHEIMDVLNLAPGDRAAKNLDQVRGINPPEASSRLPFVPRQFLTQASG